MGPYRLYLVIFSLLISHTTWGTTTSYGWVFLPAHPKPPSSNLRPRERAAGQQAAVVSPLQIANSKFQLPIQLHPN